jgi:hypothetical protein
MCVSYLPAAISLTDEILIQPWFATFDFEALMAKSITAPWLPQVSSVTDTSNFDPLPEEEVQNYGTSISITAAGRAISNERLCVVKCLVECNAIFVGLRTGIIP